MGQQAGTEKKFSKSVFISHASKNFKLADEVRGFLERQGISCWIAPRDIPAGQQYGSAIIDAIRECTVTVLVLTEESNQSKPVANEIERAFSYQKTIIPIRLRDVAPSRDLEFFVANAQWVNAYASPLKARMDEVAKIVQALEMGLPVSEPTPESPTLGGRLEMYLERVLRRKMLSAAVGFAVLASLSIAVIGLQLGSTDRLDMASAAIGSSAAQVKDAAERLEGTSDTVTRIDTKMGHLKLETSKDPRKELANMGGQWSGAGFSDALAGNDLKVLALFMDGQFNVTTVQREISQLFLENQFPQKRNVIDLLRAKGVDFVKSFPPSVRFETPIRFALRGVLLDATEWLLKHNDTSLLAHGDYEDLLVGVVMTSSWCADGPESAKRAALLLQAGASSASAFEHVYERLMLLQNATSRSPETDKEQLRCKAHLALLKPSTKNSADIERKIQAEAIKTLRSHIQFVKGIVYENRWRADDDGVEIIIPDADNTRSASYGQMKVQYAEMIKHYEKRIAELRRG